MVLFFFYFTRQGKVPSFFTICIRFYGKSPLNQSPYHSIPTNDPNHSTFFHCIHNLWDKITSTLFIMYQSTQPCMRARLVVQCIRLLVDATIIASYSRSKLQILSTSNTIHVQLLYFNLTIYLSVDFEVFFKLFTLIPEH